MNINGKTPIDRSGSRLRNYGEAVKDTQESAKQALCKFKCELLSLKSESRYSGKSKIHKICINSLFLTQFVELNFKVETENLL